MSQNYINKSYKDSDLTGKIVGFAFDIYNNLGYGFPEKIYQTALMSKLLDNGYTVDKECYCKLEFEGKRIGYFYVDLSVDQKVVVELKAQNEIINKDVKQILTYFKNKQFTSWYHPCICEERRKN